MDTAAGQFALQLDAVSIASLVGLGFLIGSLSGLFGVGGGFLLTPTLNVFFGVPYHLAVGSTLVQMALMAWVGALTHVRLKHVDFRLALSLVAGSFFGAEAGVRIQGALKGIGEFSWRGRAVPGFDLVMALLFVALLTAIGWGMVVEGRRSRRRAYAAAAKAADKAAAKSRDEVAPARDAEPLEPEQTALSRALARVSLPPMLAYSADPSRRFSFWVPAAIGLGVGVLTGLLGTGGGVINLPILIYALGVPTAVAVGTASVQTVIASIYSGARHLLLGNVVWALVFPILAGSLAGARAGALLCPRVPKDRLRAAFGWVALTTAFVVVADLCRKLS